MSGIDIMAHSHEDLLFTGICDIIILKVKKKNVIILVIYTKSEMSTRHRPCFHETGAN